MKQGKLRDSYMSILSGSYQMFPREFADDWVRSRLPRSRTRPGTRRTLAGLRGKYRRVCRPRR